MNFSFESSNFTGVGPGPVLAATSVRHFIYVVVSIISVIFVLSLVSNIFVIVVVWQNANLRSGTNILLVNVSLANLLFATIVMPCTIVSYLRSNFLFGAAFCVVYNYVQGVSVALSSYTLTVISFERYNAICRPLTARRWQTTSHCYKMVALTWILAMLTMLPIAATSQLDEHPNGIWKKCREDWSNSVLSSLEVPYSIFLDVTVFAIPLLIMTIAYMNIGLKMSKSVSDNMQLQEVLGATHGSETECKSQTGDEAYRYSRHESLLITSASSRSNSIRRQSRPSQCYQHDCVRVRMNNKRKVIRMMIVIVLEFFICWAPVYSLQTWLSIDKVSAQKHVSPTMNLVLRLLAFASTWIYPVTYCFMSSRFRRGVVQIFKCKRNRSRSRSNAQAAPRDQSQKDIEISMHGNANTNRNKIMSFLTAVYIDQQTRANSFHRDSTLSPLGNRRYRRSVL